MNRADKEDLRELIEAEMAALDRDIEGLAEGSAPVVPDSAIGRLSRLEAIADQQVQRRGLRQARQRLRLLGEALARIDENAYGICKSCAEEIPVARLKLVPESRLCVRCIDAGEGD